MMGRKFDVIIIGAGPGGYPCAIRLGQFGKKVLVVEEKYLGGLCLNWGCIPTKALSYAAEMVDNLAKARRMGLHLETRGFDLDALRNWKEGVVRRLRGGIEYLFKANNVAWQKGRGRLVSDHEIEITTGADKETCVAENIVLATGTEVTELKGFEFDRNLIIDTDDALEIKRVPKDLLVIGAGASGLEMAVIYQRLGSKVTVVEIMEQILPGMESELCDNLSRILKKSGMEIHLNAQVIGVTRKQDKVEVVIKEREQRFAAAYDQVMVTVGRRPVKDAFGDLAIEVDGRGYIRVDRALRTNIKNVYAIGDITGPPLLAHKATKQGTDCAEIIAGVKNQAGLKAIPSCVFTIPPLASVGLTEKDALAGGIKIGVGRFPYRASGKATAMLETEGLVKIIAREDGRLLGLHILGTDSASLIGEAVLALDKEMSARDLAESIHPHPTLTEMVQEAAENFYKKAIHIVNKE
jgi:dihydrolipoamide dehydrogenase